MLRILLALLLTFSLSLISSVTGVDAAVDTEEKISVKLINYIGKKDQLSFKSDGDYKIDGDDTINLISGRTYIVKVKDSKLFLYEGTKLLKEFEDNSFLLKAADYSPDSITTLYGTYEKRYIGNIQFTIEDGKYVRPINKDILFNDYLKGVLPSEMPASWGSGNGIEALKAQAVAARTYALNLVSVLKSQGKPVIVSDTQGHQVYGGVVDSSTYNKYVNTAVTGTENKVLTYNNRLIDAVFSSSNGGMIESNANAWPTSTLVPYLNVKKDKYDPQHSWGVEFDKHQIDLRGKDLSKPETWWSSAIETNPSVSNSIKSWLSGYTEYKDYEIKIVSIPNLSFSGKTSGERAIDGSITVEFLLKNKSTKQIVMDSGRVKVFTKTLDTSASKIRGIIGTGIFKSTLITSFQDRTNERLAGKDRFEVAVNVSKEGWDSSDTVVVAFYNAYADALAAGPLAYKNDAPILLTKSDKLTDITKKEIERLGAKNILVIGGIGSVSDGVFNELKAIPGVTGIERIGGRDRFEVSYNISKRFGGAQTAIIAHGLNFPDALAISPYAASKGYPIILTHSEKLTPISYEALKGLNIQQTIVVGGPASVSEAVFSKLPNPIRIGGQNRYEVAANIIYKLNLSPSKAYIATGLTFADALTGSVLAAKEKGNILLSNTHILTEPTEGVIEKKMLNNFTILGGEGSITPEAVSMLPNSSFAIDGKGFGHGVGMSQYGAKGMAALGKNYEEILGFYYPITNLVER
ncbi:SpoIID/LytB domain-containing protein [Cytobacillus sp. FSL H8-0458]|uniref:SpoIID/LytB domain-containing protein n=1 Tax=Cytobacillus sp. FSL H8-0458 TaxID=2975346 RepID=UPI0030FAA34A